MSVVLLILVQWYDQEVRGVSLLTATEISDYKHRTEFRPLRTRTDHMHIIRYMSKK
jgi:hypothetical protein